MPLGLCNAPATFARLMDRVLCGMRWSRCLVYLDDVISFGGTIAEALARLEEVLSRLSKGEEMYIYANGSDVPGSHRWPY